MMDDKLMTHRKDEHIYEWGKSLISFRVREDRRKQVSEMVIIGWDTMRAEGFRGGAKISDVNQKIGGNKDWEQISRRKDGDKRIEYRYMHEVADAAEANELGKAFLMNRSMRMFRAEAKAEGNPRLASGAIVDIKYVNKRYSGEYIAEVVVHRFSLEEGYTNEMYLKRNMFPSDYKAPGSGFVDRYANEAYKRRMAEQEAATDQADEEETNEDKEVQDEQGENTEESTTANEPDIASVLEITAQYTMQQAPWGSNIAKGTTQEMRRAGCAITLAANIAFTTGSNDVTPETINDNENNFSGANLIWENALNGTGLTINPRVNGQLTAARFNELNATEIQHYIGIMVNYSGNEAKDHCVGASELAERNGNQYYRISPTSEQDYIMGTTIDFNNRGGMGWQVENGNIYVPLNRVTAYRVFDVPAIATYIN